MKKLGVALLLVVLLFTMAGCKQSEHGLDPKNPTVVTAWHYYNGAQKESFDALVSDFNDTVGAEKGIVVVAYGQGSVNELQTQVMDSIEKRVGAQETPDIFAAYADTAYAVNAIGKLADISAYLTEAEQAAYIDAYMEEGRLEGGSSLKIFPIAKSTEALYVNKTAWDIFAQDTGADEALFSTWEGIAELSRMYYEWTDAMTPEPGDGKAFYGRDAMANYMLIGSLQLGHEMFVRKDGKTEITLDREALRRIWDCYYVPYVNGYFTASGRFRSDDMKTGDLIAYVGSTPSSTYFPTEVTREDGSTYPIEGKVYPLPNFEGTEPVAVQQGAGMVVVKSDETHEFAAVEFLKWFTQEEQNVAFSVGSGYLPVTKTANDWSKIDKVITEQYADMNVILKNSLHIGIDTVANYKLYTPSPFEKGAQARSILESALNDAAKQAYAQVQALVEQGTAREEAVEGFTTDEVFDAWADDLQAQMDAL